MIKAILRRRLEQEIEDMLGGDPVLRGEPRVGTYTGIEVTMYDSDTEQDFGSFQIFNVPRGAWHSWADIAQHLKSELIRITGDPEATHILVEQIADFDNAEDENAAIDALIGVKQ